MIWIVGSPGAGTTVMDIADLLEGLPDSSSVRDILNGSTDVAQLSPDVLRKALMALRDEDEPVLGALNLACDWQDCCGTLDDVKRALQAFDAAVQVARESRAEVSFDASIEPDVLRRMLARNMNEMSTPDRNSNGDPFSKADHLSLKATCNLSARLQAIRASLSMLLTRLEAFEERASGRAPGLVERSRESYRQLCSRFNDSSSALEQLRIELDENRWRAVQQHVIKVVNEMLDSLEITIRRIDATSLSADNIGPLIDRFELKRSCYMRSIPTFLDIFRQSNVIRPASLSGIEGRWHRVASDVEDMTRRLHGAKSAGIVHLTPFQRASRQSSDRSSKSHEPSTPVRFRKDTSLLPPRASSRLSSSHAMDSPARPPWNAGNSQFMARGELSVTPARPSSVLSISRPQTALGRLTQPTAASLARTSSNASPRKSGIPTPKRTLHILETNQSPERRSMLPPPSTPARTASRHSNLPASTLRHVLRPQTPGSVNRQTSSGIPRPSLGQKAPRASVV
ncbi:hypothetical protein PYCC9005_005381 [Savitreella phatthalungensis]